MNEIRLLDKQTIDKIAAGEVVDRPASIVKELVENAIDAGSTSVSVEIRDGGISFIRITDNGSGIPADQISLAFLRHSTSKIKDAGDLSFIHTLGFRGEALSSIAAVSRCQLMTKTKNALTGVIYQINGGVEESCSEAGLPDGTTLIVRDLFYNVPARRKFLKTAQTEAGYVTDVIHRSALSHPEVAFKYAVNGMLKLNTPGNGSLKDVIYAVFGRDITSHLLEIEEQDQVLSVSGFIGKPEIARGNRSFEFFFVNGRFIRDNTLQKALEEAYTGYQMKGTFPFAVLNITLEPELIDVNVHPSKMEIRFFNRETVFHSVYEILRHRITRRESIPSVTPGKSVPDVKAVPIKAVSVPEPFERPEKEPPVFRQETFLTRKPLSVQTASQLHEDPSWHAAVPDVPEDTIPRFLEPAARIKHRMVGVVFDTYWIIEYEDAMYLIDQHAAHEKVLYERFQKRMKEEKHYAQKILPALILTLSAAEEAVLTKHLESFRETGFEIEHFGGSEYALRSVPADLYSVEPRQLFLEMLEDLKDTSSVKGAEVMNDRIATAACKAAVKGGNRLSLTEANALIDELLSLDNPYNCPHGRPTLIRMSRQELEKKFKRIV